MDQGYFLLRGLGKVRAEFSLTVLAYNLKRVIRHRWRPADDGRTRVSVLVRSIQQMLDRQPSESLGLTSD